MSTCPRLLGQSFRPHNIFNYAVAPETKLFAGSRLFQVRRLSIVAIVCPVSVLLGSSVVTTPLPHQASLMSVRAMPMPYRWLPYWDRVCHVSTFGSDLRLFRTCCLPLSYFLYFILILDIMVVGWRTSAKTVIEQWCQMAILQSSQSVHKEWKRKIDICGFIHLIR